MFWKYNFLLPYENKDKKILTLVGKWVFWVWVWFYPNPFIFMGFPFLKTIPTQLPNPTHFFGFFWMSLTGFSGLTQPWTPLHIYSRLYLGHILFIAYHFSVNFTLVNCHLTWKKISIKHIFDNFTKLYKFNKLIYPL